MKREKNQQIYQLKVTLRDIRPPIWRRFQVRGDVTLDRLHQVLQEVMGWTDSHLHMFTIGGVDYGEPDPEFDDWGNSQENEMTAKLNQIVTYEKSKFSYMYDFGDGWEHVIVVENIFLQEGSKHAVCVAGACACPPEDCGGVGEYEELVEAMKNPRGKRHRELVDWLGEEFQPEAFDLDEVNQRLKRIRLN